MNLYDNNGNLRKARRRARLVLITGRSYKMVFSGFLVYHVVVKNLYFFNHHHLIFAAPVLAAELRGRNAL
jgi:hypothetical protein